MAGRGRGNGQRRGGGGVPGEIVAKLNTIAARQRAADVRTKAVARQIRADTPGLPGDPASGRQTRQRLRGKYARGNPRPARASTVSAVRPRPKATPKNAFNANIASLRPWVMDPGRQLTIDVVKRFTIDTSVTPDEKVMMFMVPGSNSEYCAYTTRLVTTGPTVNSGAYQWFTKIRADAPALLCPRKFTVNLTNVTTNRLCAGSVVVGRFATQAVQAGSAASVKAAYDIITDANRGHVYSGKELQDQHRINAIATSAIDAMTHVAWAGGATTGETSFDAQLASGRYDLTPIVILLNETGGGANTYEVTVRAQYSLKYESDTLLGELQENPPTVGAAFHAAATAFETATAGVMHEAAKDAGVAPIVGAIAHNV